MGNVNMEASQINYRGGEKKMSVEEALKNTSGEAAAIAQLQEDVSNLNGSKANRVDIATEFSDLTNYNAGDLVYYEGDLYEFQVDHTAGSWETSEVIQKDLSDIITTLKSGLTELSPRGNAYALGSSTSTTPEAVTISISNYKYIILQLIVVDGDNGNYVVSTSTMALGSLIQSRLYAHYYTNGDDVCAYLHQTSGNNFELYVSHSGYMANVIGFRK